MIAQLRNYAAVWATFARNSLVRDMTFRTNFIFQCISSVCWTAMNVGFYLILFQFTDTIGRDTGWRQDEFFLFLATTWFINSMVQAFFMPNAEEFSEMIRTGGLDFALLKPIDTQFLISFRKIDWSALANFLAGIIMAGISIYRLTTRAENVITITPVTVLLYLFFLICGVMIMYSVMICLSATSVWLGRNQTLYNFWFYITNFSRYPMEIYNQGWGAGLWFVFTFIIPVLVVVNVPAQIMAQPVSSSTPYRWHLAAFGIFATMLSVLFSRWLFKTALKSYRSASS
ncbi:MAG: ABC-2 family transporter protein [Planctomycetota bacterium]